MRRIPRRRGCAAAFAIVVADIRAAGLRRAGPVAARRLAHLQRPVRLRAGEDVVLIRLVAHAIYHRALLRQRIFLAEHVHVGVKVGDALGDDHTLHVHPRALADAIARVDRRLPVRGRRAEIRAPGAIPCSRCGRQRLAVLIGSRQPAEVGPVARSGAGDEETHLILLRRHAQGSNGRQHRHSEDDCYPLRHLLSSRGPPEGGHYVRNTGGHHILLASCLLPPASCLLPPSSPLLRIIRVVIRSSLAAAIGLVVAVALVHGQQPPSSPSPNAIVAGELLLEPPTLINLGFEWFIQGDANRNASVAVSYRKQGDAAWRDALPLLRLQGEHIYAESRIDVISPNMFAGSVLDLEPATAYEVQLVMTDPDGVTGESRRVVNVRTRAEPTPYRGGRTFHVYPHGFKGTKIEPAFEGLMCAYNEWCAGTDWATSGRPRVRPGDTILVHAGTYKYNRYEYTNNASVNRTVPLDGTYYLTADGTAEMPIAIGAAGDGEVVL